MCTLSYECRDKIVKKRREAELWTDITPEVISEEEKFREQYVWHPPAYWSDHIALEIHVLNLCLWDVRRDDKECWS